MLPRTLGLRKQPRPRRQWSISDTFRSSAAALPVKCSGNQPAAEFKSWHIISYNFWGLCVCAPEIDKYRPYGTTLVDFGHHILWNAESKREKGIVPVKLSLLELNLSLNLSQLHVTLGEQGMPGVPRHGNRSLCAPGRVTTRDPAFVKVTSTSLPVGKWHKAILQILNQSKSDHGPVHWVWPRPFWAWGAGSKESKWKWVAALGMLPPSDWD